MGEPNGPKDAADATENGRSADQAVRLAPRPVVDAIPATARSVILYSILVDQSEALVYISPTVEELLGHPPEAFMAERGLWGRHIHPDDRDRVRAEMNRTAPGVDRYASAYRLLARGGDVVDVYDTAVLVRDLHGHPLCWQGVVTVSADTRFQRLASDSGDLVSVMSTTGLPTYLCPDLEHLAGSDRAEHGQDDGLAFVHPADRTHLRALLHALELDPESVVTLELRISDGDGGWRWMEATGTNRLHDPDIDGLVVIWRDISERRANAAALDLLNRAVAVTSNGIAIVDMNDPVQSLIEVNPAFERMTGYVRAEVLGRNCRFLQGPETNPESVSAIRAAIAAGREVHTSLLNYRKDGTPFWNELRLAPVLDPQGGLTHYVGILNDITDQRLAEEELRVHGELLEQATVAVIATDTRGRITHWNRHAERIYGWHESEAVGQSIYGLIAGPMNLRQDRAILRRLRAGQAWEGEYTCRRKDGTSLDVHVAISPVLGAEGRIDRIVSVSHDITVRKSFEAGLHYQATHDQLTGLPNHLHFSQHLERALHQAVRNRQSIGLLYLDLDRFKLINDGLGHAAGDAFLVEMSRRLISVARELGLVARLGGDEFAVLLDTASADTARAVADRVLAAISGRLVLEGRELYPSVSIGLVLSSPDHARPHEVLRAGDVALYQAKRAGRGTYVLFDPVASDLTSGWLSLEADLRGGIERQELSLAYQPIISLTDGRVGAVEALLRWQHPERGPVPTTEFVPVAEETGLITVITEWALKEACLQLATWRRDLGEMAPSSVNVNLSTRALRDPALVDRIMASLDVADLPPECLRLEITEQVLLEELRAAAPTLRRLRDEGIRLAVDDFGAGASSLASLWTVDVEVLKLDRSFAAFLSQEDNQVVIGAVTTMAHALGLEVTAEGIERPEHLRVARAAGCDWGQGYLLARPMPAGEMTGVLATAPWNTHWLAPRRRRR
ncbi:MAG TPA: EAL domain-containing protein [Thermomicrobiales bacterium]|jgi:diguanylate cyclase (GGDEF)-like protein/PAS domain S-box-containing protein|nr:EAL domain-containing protein [Thermomicrobiales bacterium]